VSIGRFRSDAKYTLKLVDLMDGNGIDFFIRIRNSSYLRNEIIKNKLWEEGYIQGRKIETCSFDYFIATNGRHSKDHRAVVTRVADYEGTYSYRGILTNNRSMSDQEVVDFYNLG